MPAKKAATPASPEPAEETGVPIVVRRAIMKDDSTVDSATTTESVEASNPIEVKSKKSRIEPLSKPVEETTPEAVAPAEPAAPASDSSKSPEAANEVPKVAPAAPAPAKADTPEPRPTSEGGEFTLAGEDSVDTPEDPSQNPIDQAKAKADKEAAEKQAALDKLVDAQTYFLPLNKTEKRRSKQLLFVTLLLLVVLAGAGLFWANGQGIISVPGL